MERQQLACMERQQLACMERQQLACMERQQLVSFGLLIYIQLLRRLYLYGRLCGI
jgi:hypothetical protein